MKAKITLFLACLLLCFLVYPSAFIYPKDTLPDKNDTRLISYIIGQVQQNILNFQPLYHGQFFASQQNTLTYSDLFLTTAVITLPFHLFADSPIAIFNLGFILNFTLTCYFAHTFFEYIFKNKYTASLTSLLFILSGYHLHYYAHLQIFSLWIFFAALLNLYKFLKTKQSKYFIYFLIFTTLQLAESIFTTYLLFFASFFLSLTNIKSLILEFYKPRSLIFIVVWSILLYPYAKLHFSFPEATRPIRDAAHFSLGLDEIFTKYHSWTAILALIATSVIPAKAGIHKISTNLYRFRIKSGMTKVFKKLYDLPSTIYLLFFSLIMSLGPVLKIFGQNQRVFDFPIPLPYSFFYYLFPGFNGFRTPSRFIVLALFAACLIVGQKINPILNKLKPKTKIVFITFIFILLCLESNLPLTGYPINTNLPTVYNQVKLLSPTAIILELPIKLWNTPNHEIESIRSLYSLEHKHRRFGGYSGFATNNWIKLVEEINSYGLTSDVIQKLQTLGVTHVIKDNNLTTLSAYQSLHATP